MTKQNPKGPPTTIPIEKIDTGIAYCLYNSNQLSGITEELLNNPRKYYTDAFLVALYYYALEEFGKGLYLERLKKESTTKIVKAYLFDHDLKIEEAKKNHPDLIIRKLELKSETPFKTDTILGDGTTTSYQDETMKFQSYELAEEIIKRFGESSLWLTDYHEETESWNHEVVVDDVELQRKIAALKKHVSELQRNYH